MVDFDSAVLSQDKQAGFAISPIDDAAPENHERLVRFEEH
jgi:hypothetical protein